MQSRSFERFGGAMAILGALSALLYAISFIILQNALFSGLFLMLLGILSVAALTALYYRVRGSDPAFGLWALLLSLIAGAGAAAHGGYDLAMAINPPGSISPVVTNPSPVDPRGLLSIGFAGIAILTFSWLMTRSLTMPDALGYLGYVSGLLLVILYVGRLIVPSPANLIILVPALLSGLIVNPIWYLWVGIALLHPTTGRAAPYQGPDRRVIERRQMQL